MGKELEDKLNKMLVLCREILELAPYDSENDNSKEAELFAEIQNVKESIENL